MSSGYGIVGPSSYPVRSPKDKAQRNGRILNGPRYYDRMGGLTGPSKWPGRNEMRVESPTNVGKVTRTAKDPGWND